LRLSRRRNILAPRRTSDHILQRDSQSDRQTDSQTDMRESVEVRGITYLKRERRCKKI